MDMKVLVLCLGILQLAALCAITRSLGKSSDYRYELMVTAPLNQDLELFQLVI